MQRDRRHDLVVNSKWFAGSQCLCRSNQFGVGRELLALLGTERIPRADALGRDAFPVVGQALAVMEHAAASLPELEARPARRS